jgi:hypothetical protein
VSFRDVTYAIMVPRQTREQKKYHTHYHSVVPHHPNLQEALGYINFVLLCPRTPAESAHTKDHSLPVKTWHETGPRSHWRDSLFLFSFKQAEQNLGRKITTTTTMEVERSCLVASASKTNSDISNASYTCHCATLAALHSIVRA